MNAIKSSNRLIHRTDSSNSDFKNLVAALDAELAEKDGHKDHAYYDQFNKIDMIRHAVVAFEGGEPVGCGALKEHESGAMEIKRMYVVPDFRGKGISVKLLNALEEWAKEMSFTKCILETGKRQPEALRFYQKHGYKQMPNYGQYAGIENSMCFSKKL